MLQSMSCLVLPHVTHVPAGFAGLGWADFNSAQVLTRRNMLAMYGARRKLFRRDFLSGFLRHVYVELFIVQVCSCREKYCFIFFSQKSLHEYAELFVVQVPSCQEQYVVLTNCLMI